MTENQRIQAVQTINEVIDCIKITKDQKEKAQGSAEHLAYAHVLTNALYEGWGMAKLLYMTGMINERQYLYIEEAIYNTEYLTVDKIRKVG